MPSLAEAYIAGDPAVAACLGGPPEAVWSRKPKARPWATGVAKAVAAYNDRLGLDRTIDGDEPVVVTGQQPGLFTGPLYTIYKAITCIGLAGELSRQHGRSVVPIFWVGSEDHDFDEAHTVYTLAKDHKPLELTYTPKTDIDGLPMHAVPIESQLRELAETLTRSVPGSEFTGEIQTLLEETLEKADSLADWCARLLARLFCDTPLVLFAPHLHEARAASRDVIRQAIDHPRETTRLLNAGGEALAEKGYDAQVVKAPEECAFFLEWRGRRRKVIHDGEHFFLPEENVQCSADDLHRWLDESPERFSPNVALRCIVQQALYPTLAYVAGPGEVAYWAQLKEVFRWHEQPMPVVYPRVRARVSNIKVNRLREELEIDDDRLYHHPEELVAHALQSVEKSPALDVIDQYRQRLKGTAAAFCDALAGKARPDTLQSAQKIAEALDRDLEKLARREALADKARVSAVRARVDRVCATLAPDRKPQERVYTVFSFLFQQGLGLIPRMMETFDVRDFSVQEIEL